MNFTKEMEKSLKIQKQLKEISDMQSGKTFLISLFISAYWLTAFIINSGYDKNIYKLIFAAIIFAILLIFSDNLKVTCLICIAQSLLLIHSFWVIAKVIFFICCSIFCFLFKITNKLKEKYDNLDEDKKSFVNSLIFVIIGLALRYVGKEIISNATNTDSSFVNPHDVNGYTRADGTKVDGYYRDGDGNPFTSLTKEQGGGYFRRK